MAKATPALEITQTETPPPKPRKRGGKPVAIEEHTVVTKWAEEKKVGAPPPKARKASPVEEIEDDDDAEENEVDLPEDVRAVLSEYDSASGLVMEINRLPNYHLNGKQDPASMQFCGDRDFDPQEYKNILRLYYAKEGVPNFFIIKLKTSDRQWIPGGRIGPINVEAATPEEKARHGIYVAPPEQSVTVSTTQAIPYPYQPAAPVPQQSFTDRISEVAQVYGIFKEMGLVPKQQQNPQPVQVEQSAPRLSEEDIIVRAALSSPEAQDRIAKGLFSKLIGGASAVDETPWYADMLKEVVIGLVPGLNALAQVAAQKMSQAQMTVMQQQQAVPIASLPEQPQAIEAPPQEPMASPPPEQPQPEDILFAQIFLACQRRKLVKPEVCAKGVLDLVDAHTAENGYSPFNTAVDIFLSAEVEQIMAFAATQNPIAAKMASEPDVLPWLKAVQDEIRKEWEQNGEDSQTN